jgi:hypothetical protein
MTRSTVKKPPTAKVEFNAVSPTIPEPSKPTGV